MGLDAPSTDLTARIQSRRRALVLEGTVDPLRPGERVIHGRQPGAHASFETTGGAQARAFEARTRRSEQVVDMDYTDYRASADADEPFEVGAGDGDGAGDGAGDRAGDEPEQEDSDTPLSTEELLEAAAEDEALLYTEAATTAPEPAEDVLEDTALDARLEGIEVALGLLGQGVDERFDSIGAGFLALAKGLSEELAGLRKELADVRLHVEEHRLNTELRTEDVAMGEKKKSWWKRLGSFVWGS